MRRICSKSHRPNVKGMNKWMMRKRISESEFESGKSWFKMYKGALDIFQCERVMFPMNENNNHWVMYSMNPSTLEMILFDSLHSQMTAKRFDVASCIHEWLLHSVRHGRPHARAHNEWSLILCLETGW
jgi:Ulp1 family protease